MLRRSPTMEVRMKKDKRTEADKNRSRDQYITFRVTEQERDKIDKRMAQTGMKNRRAYLLKMATEGQVVNIELDCVHNMVRLLSNATNNINQIAKRANTTGSIYAADIEEISLRYEELWKQAKQILRELGDLL